MRITRQQMVRLGVLLVLALAVLLVAPWLGVIPIKFSAAIFALGSPQADVFWQLRVSRVLVAFVAGAALAVGGMTFQAMFRNVLATPYTLGIASGAAFGVTLGVRLGLGPSWGWFDVLVICALLGAVGTMCIVGILASPARGFSTESMLLAGVITSFFFSSLVLLLQYVSNSAEVFQVTRWLMGSVDIVGYGRLVGVSPFLIIGFLIIFAQRRDLDIMTLGDELAVSRGLRPERSRALFFLGASLLVAAVVALCGPIGFVGLIVPCVCRRILGGISHRALFWAVVLAGGVFLTTCDTVARMVVAPFEVPVGVVTALLGGPFFLWVLMRRGTI